MIYQEAELTIKVNWLDPENVDKAKRKTLVMERLLKLFSHQFGEATVDQHRVEITVVAIDGIPIMEEREIKEPSGVSSSDNARGRE